MKGEGEIWDEKKIIKDWPLAIENNGNCQYKTILDDDDSITIGHYGNISQFSSTQLYIEHQVQWSIFRLFTGTFNVFFFCSWEWVYFYPNKNDPWKKSDIHPSSHYSWHHNNPGHLKIEKLLLHFNHHSHLFYIPFNIINSQLIWFISIKRRRNKKLIIKN